MSSGKLRFKGTANQPKKSSFQRPKKNPIPPPPPSESPQWKKASKSTDLVGPIYIVICCNSSTESTLWFNSESQTIAKPTSQEEQQPQHISQILVASTFDFQSFHFKSPFLKGKYLAVVDKLAGQVEFRSEAISIREQWQIQEVEEGQFVFKSIFSHGYLQFFQGELRADCQRLQEATHFGVYFQAKEVDKEVSLNGAGEGELQESHESLLMKRVKLKSDKFC